MKQTIKYLSITLKHKWFVFLAGVKTKTPLYLLIIHDWSKFLPSESKHYGRQFFGAADDPLGFSYAWNYHQKRHPHHPEYWQMGSGHTRGGFPDGYCLPIPEKYAREMVADWFAACRAYEGHWPKTLESWVWWQKHFPKVKLHPDTRKFCEELVKKIIPTTSI